MLFRSNYDLEQGPLSQARIEFWKRMAAQFGGPVLDLCCGTGLVAIPVAAMGLSVTGVDLSAPMLAHAQAKAERDDIDVRWIQSDVRDLALPRRFGFVILAGNAFQAFLERGDQDALLAAARRHLAPEGVFAFDIDQRPGHDLSDDVEHLLDVAGFEIVAQYGDWDFSRFRPASERLITLCRLEAGA